MYSRQSTNDAFWFDMGDISFEPVNDVGPMTEYRAMGLLVRALVVWLATGVLGGALLAATISFVARIFYVPEFAEHQPMGFMMAGVLGFGVATWFTIHSLQEARAGG